MSRDNFETPKHLFMDCGFFNEFREFIDYWVVKISGRGLPNCELIRIHAFQVGKYFRSGAQAIRSLIIYGNFLMWIARCKIDKESKSISNGTLIRQFQIRIKKQIIRDFLEGLQR